MIGNKEYFLGGNSDDEEEGDTARFAARMQLNPLRPPSPTSDGSTSDDDVGQSNTRRRYYGQPARLARVNVAHASVPPTDNVASAANVPSTGNVASAANVSSTATSEDSASGRDAWKASPDHAGPIDAHTD